MDFGLAGKIALVTASSRGLGLAIAEDLAMEGVTVVISARKAETLEAAAQSLRAATGAKVIGIRADCTKADEVDFLVGETERRYGAVDILINNSAGPPTAPFEQLSDADWRDAVEIKLLPQIRCARAVFPAMVERRWGRIITLVGTHGRQPHAYAITAGVVNAALLNLTKALAELGAPANVLVNAVNPGPIETERMKYLIAEKAREDGISEARAKEILSEEVLLRRFGDPKEVAAAVVFLASERASFITGAMIDVDGGQTRAI